MGSADEQGVNGADRFDVFLGVRKAVKHIAHGVETCALFAIGFDHRPRRIGSIGIEKHRFFGLGVILPFIEGGKINGRELPLLEGMSFSFFEATSLLFLADGKPELDEMST